MSFKTVIIAAALLAVPASAMAQQQPQGKGHRGGQVCSNAALSDADKAACTSDMQKAASREDRQKVRQTYTGKIQAAGGTVKPAQ